METTHLVSYESRNVKRKKSFVWPHFIKVHGTVDFYGSDMLAACKYCDQIVSYNTSSVTNLEEHLQRKHGFISKNLYQDRSAANLSKLTLPLVDPTRQPETKVIGTYNEIKKKKSYVNFKDMKYVLKKKESIRMTEIPKRRKQNDIKKSSKPTPDPTAAQTRNDSLSQHETDEDKLFALSLIPTLKHMAENEKLVAKMRILQVFQEVRKMNTSQNSLHSEDLNSEDVEYLDEDLDSS